VVVGAWWPKVGERVRFVVQRRAHPAVPLAGEGVIVRNIRRNRAEQCDYEVSVEGYGDLCFFRSELARWTP
jgi:hypothetical protein